MLSLSQYSSTMVRECYYIKCVMYFNSTSGANLKKYPSNGWSKNCTTPSDWVGTSRITGSIGAWTGGARTGVESIYIAPIAAKICPRTTYTSGVTGKATGGVGASGCGRAEAFDLCFSVSKGSSLFGNNGLTLPRHLPLPWRYTLGATPAEGTRLDSEKSKGHLTNAQQESTTQEDS